MKHDEIAGCGRRVTALMRSFAGFFIVENRHKKGAEIQPLQASKTDHLLYGFCITLRVPLFYTSLLAHRFQ